MRLTDTQESTIALIACGALLLIDDAPLSADEFLFLYGLTLVVGMRDTLYFHAQEQKARGNLWFLGWALFVLIEWRSAIFIVKILGFLRLFSGISVTILTFSRGLPFIGRLFAPPRFLDAAAAFKNTFSTKRPL